MSEKKILNETNNHNPPPPPFKLNGRSLSQMTKTWWEAPICMGGSVLSFLKVEWKVSDTGSAHWASSFYFSNGNKLFLLSTISTAWT